MIVVDYWHRKGVLSLDKPIEEYSIESPPPKGHKELGLWIWGLFEDAYAEKERLGLMDRWVANYRMFRGDHWGYKGINKPNRLSINLYFANIQRTVANITAKNPVVEVVDMDGVNDGADEALTTRVRKYWHESEQQASLATSCQNNEIYGITVEKHGWSIAGKNPISIVLDAYSFFPAPGYIRDIQDLPYVIHAYAMDVYAIEKMFNQKPGTIDAEDVRNILGREDREEARPNNTMMNRESGIVEQQYKNTSEVTGRTSRGKGEGLVVECWFRDESMPDGIRVVLVANRGRVVLADMENPNINLEIDQEAIQETYAWGRYPFSYVNSYEDSTSIWGFSAGEQVGDLNKRIDEMVSRMVAWANFAMFPPLRVDAGCGITKNMINNKPGLVLMPTRPNARIEFVPVPNPPAALFQVLDILTGFHDRIYQIEDADRGVQPTGVTAASAIVALQERNSVLIQHKIRAMESIARERGRWAISGLLNFATDVENLDIRGTTVTLQGVALAGRRFNYMVESGSTVARTSIQQQEQAMSLYRDKAIDRQALLETLNFPGWKQIIERVGEGQLDQALQILVQAGMDEEQASVLKQQLLEPQAGGIQGGGGSQEPQPGTPKSMQGGIA